MYDLSVETVIFRTFLCDRSLRVRTVRDFWASVKKILLICWRCETSASIVAKRWYSSSWPQHMMTNTGSLIGKTFVSQKVYCFALKQYIFTNVTCSNIRHSSLKSYIKKCAQGHSNLFPTCTCILPLLETVPTAILFIPSQALVQCFVKYKK